MHGPSAHVTGRLTEREWSVLVDAVAALEQAWRQSPPAGLAPFLPDVEEALKTSILVELIKVDQEQRWQRGEPGKLEEYLKRWPELARDEAIVEELLHAECLTRAVLADFPAEGELQERFPRVAGRIDLAAIRQEAVADERPCVPRAGNRTVAQTDDTQKSQSTDHDTQTGEPHGPRKADRAGERFGRYELREFVGRGGMGTVYRAFDTHLQREVALKFPHFAAAAEPATLERFMREARTAAGLRHRHICPVYDAGEIDGHYYIAMAFIEGAPLDRWIADGRPAPREAADLVCKLAEALEAIHDAGVIHRDVKPGNVLIDRQDEPVLTDFGLARPVEGAERLTGSGSLLGTPVYMAPEQVDAAHRQVDRRADIYSLGAVFYQLLTGRRPFSGALMQVLYDIGHKEPAPPQQLRPEVDDRLQAICLRMMAKQPDERYATAGAVADDLRAALQLQEQPVPAAAAAQPPARWWVRRLVAAAGAAAVLLAAVVFYLNTGEGRLMLTVNEPDVVVEVDGEQQHVRVESPRDSIEIAVPVGRRQLKVTKDGFTVYSTEFHVTRNGTTAISAKLLPHDVPPEPKEDTPAKPAPDELAEIARAIDAGLPADPFDDRVVNFRQRLLDYRRQHAGTGRALQAATLMSGLPWPVDQLRRDQIDPYELAIAGNGDPSAAPPEIVAIFGDSRMRHWAHVTAFAWSADGRWIVSGGDDFTLRLWDAATRRQQFAWNMGGVPLSVAVAPIGDTISVGTSDGRLVLLDVTARKERWSIKTGDGIVERVTFTPDGERLASASRESNILRLWDAGSGAEQNVIEHDSNISDVAFDPEGAFLAVATTSAICLWQMPALEERGRIDIPEEHRAVSIAVSPDGKQLAWGTIRRHRDRWGPDATLTVWDVEMGQPVLHKTDLYSLDLRRPTVTFSADGRMIGSRECSRCRVWDAKTGEQLATIPLAGSICNTPSVQFDPHGNRVAVAEGYGLPIWDLDEFEQRPGAYAWRDEHFAVSDDGRWLARPTEGETITVYDLGTGMPVRSLNHPFEGFAPFWRLDFSPDGRSLAAVTLYAERLVMWDVHTGTQKWQVDVQGRNDMVRFSPDERVMATVEGNKLILRETEAGRPQRSFQLGERTGRGLAFSPDGAYVARGSEVWKVASGELVRTFEWQGEQLFDVCFSPAGTKLAAAGGHFWSVWAFDTGERLYGFGEGAPRGEIMFHSVDFSPDGQTLVVAPQQWRGLRIHDTNTGKLKRSLEFGPNGHTITSEVYYTPDGRHIVCANANGTVYVLRLRGYSPGP